MALKLTNLNVDLMSKTASVSISGQDQGKHVGVSLHFTMEEPGTVPEHRLREAVQVRAKRVLEAALSALVEPSAHTDPTHEGAWVQGHPDSNGPGE